MTELRRLGFSEQHQQIHDIARCYARERRHPLLRRMAGIGAPLGKARR